VHDARQAGVTIVLDGTPPPDAVDARRGAPREAPAVPIPVHVIGDAAGTGGLASALAIAARVAADL
jgi:hypothetical protein